MKITDSNEQNKTTISCDVCQDLIPLVLDHVASKDSEILVSKHIESCANCRISMGGQTITTPPVINDQSVMHTIRKSIYISCVMLLIFGALFGIVLSNGNNIFYNIIIMPMVGALAYLLFQNRWYIPCMILPILSYIGISIGYLIEGDFTLSMPLFFTFIYTILALFGVVIAALLQFAFGKERDGHSKWSI